MEAYTYAITALLHSITYRDEPDNASAVSESEFLPFDLSYLRDLPEQREKNRSSFGENGRHESRLAPA
jgi:hypothetical protein